MNGDNREPEDRPITALVDLRERPSPGFLGKVRRRIDRRVLGVGLVTFAWHGPFLVLREFLDILFGLLGPADDGKGDSS